MREIAIQTYRLFVVINAILSPLYAAAFIVAFVFTGFIPFFLLALCWHAIQTVLIRRYLDHSWTIWTVSA